ncbi:MAG: PD40 domain-containing protein [Chloroflexota bacterium]|nr:PD40 domain-containing protein [Chloroflexota bacterium]
MTGWRVGLLPYAFAALAIVVASAIALVPTAREPASIPLGAPPTTAPRPTPPESGRLAYWRAGAGGRQELWVSDVAGTRRSVVASAPAGSDVGLTRWSADGERIAYSLDGTAVGVARAAAGATAIAIPAALRADHWTIVSLSWAPDASLVAATLRAANGLGDESDVYLVEPRAGAQWRRATTIGDAYAGEWIDAERLFVETTTGMIALLDAATLELRPFTGIPAVSPLVGRDGRVYFVGGGAMGETGASRLPTASGWVWSATIDGDDVRREERAPHEQMRLLGVLDDGRGVVGLPGSVYVSGEDLVALPYRAGNVSRVVVSPDGHRLLALADPRIVQIDTARIPRRLADGTPPASAATVVLDGALAPDVWLRSSPIALAHAHPPVDARAPVARLAFVLGGTVWESRPGLPPRPILSAGTARGYVGQLAWSPAGDGLAATIEAPGPPSLAQTLVVRGNGEWRLTVGGRIERVSWAPDGRSVAVTATATGAYGDTDVRVYDADSGTAAQRIRSASASWTRLGLLVLDSPAATQASGAPQHVELVSASGARAVTDDDRLADDPLLADLGSGDLAIQRVAASGDGRLLAMWVRGLTPSGGNANGALVVTRVSDGRALWVRSFGLLPMPQDVAWSPSGALLGWTLRPTTGEPEASTTARAVDGATGRTVIERDGRFAGWSPDGAWMYVARDEGLYAYPVDGGEGVRVSAIGVPVAATTP